MNDENEIKQHFEKDKCENVSKFEAWPQFTQTNVEYPNENVEIKKEDDEDDETITVSKKELFEYEQNINNKYETLENNITLCKEEIKENFIDNSVEVKLENDKCDYLQYSECNVSSIMENQNVNSDLISNNIIAPDGTNIANDMKKECIKTSTQNEHKTANNKKYICPECEYQTNILSALKRHLVTHNDVRPYECTICKKHYKLKDKLEQHSLIHSNEKRFLCDRCGYKTSNQRYLLRHIKSNHFVEKLHKCTKCEYETSYNYCLKTHLLKHSMNGERKFKCSYCTYRTSYKGTLKRHVEMKHIKTVPEEVKDHNKMYSCLKCAYKTNLKNNYTSHIKRHAVRKVFECKICNKDLCSKQRLDQHNRIHTGELFKCNLCDYGASQKTSLKRHIHKKHQIADDRIKCPECEYETTNKTDMKQHFIVHSDIKPFKCEMCDKSFKRSGDLNSHVLIHSDNKKFQCAHCDYKGNRKKDFILHLNSKHLYTS